MNAGKMNVLIRAEALSSFTQSILAALNVPEHKARLVATSLVEANLRGVDSHGVQLLPYYVEQIEAGDMNPAAEGRAISESGACLLYDGGNGIGQGVAEACCEHGVRIARQHRVSMVVSRE